MYTFIYNVDIQLIKTLTYLFLEPLRLPTAASRTTCHIMDITDVYEVGRLSGESFERFLYF